MSAPFISLGTHVVDGIAFVIKQGDKGPTDRVVEWNGQRIKGDVLFFLFDFLGHNEDGLYPPPLKGWCKLLDAIRDSYVLGYEWTIDHKDSERKAKRVRDGRS
jgi:hypothetical protein